MWRRTLNSWGYSPLDQINAATSRACSWSGRARWGPGSRRARRSSTTASCSCRIRGLHPGDERGHRRTAVGVQAEVARRPDQGISRCPAINRNLAIYGTTSSTRAPTTSSSRSTRMSGKLLWETQIVDFRKNAAQETSGPIIANGKIISTRAVSRKAVPRPASSPLTTPRPGKELWRQLHDSQARGAGERNVGRYSLRKALARRRLDGAELRSRAEPRVRRHVGHLARAEVHARRQRQTVPLSQLHAGPERRHRQDRVVLPAHRRSLGFRSSVRAAAGGHRRSRRTREGQLDQSEAQSGERRKVSPAFPARPAWSTRSTARPASFCGPRRRSARTSSATSTATGEVTVNPETLFTAAGQER